MPIEVIVGIPDLDSGEERPIPPMVALSQELSLWCPAGPSPGSTGKRPGSLFPVEPHADENLEVPHRGQERVVHLVTGKAAVAKL